MKAQDQHKVDLVALSENIDRGRSEYFRIVKSGLPRKQRRTAERAKSREVNLLIRKFNSLVGHRAFNEL